MWRSKKLIIVAVIAAVVLVGSIGGVVLAQTGNGDEGQPKAQYEALLDKVCAIYEQNTGTAIDAQELQKAFIQAQSEMREAVLQNRFQYLVEEGKITQEKADQYLEWWQARPDNLLGFGFCGGNMYHFGGFNKMLMSGWCVPAE